jgi:hypothetical protein
MPPAWTSLQEAAALVKDKDLVALENSRPEKALVDYRETAC